MTPGEMAAYLQDGTIPVRAPGTQTTATGGKYALNSDSSLAATPTGKVMRAVAQSGRYMAGDALLSGKVA